MEMTTLMMPRETAMAKKTDSKVSAKKMTADEKRKQAVIDAAVLFVAVQDYDPAPGEEEHPAVDLWRDHADASLTEAVENYDRSRKLRRAQLAALEAEIDRGDDDETD